MSAADRDGAKKLARLMQRDSEVNRWFGAEPGEDLEQHYYDQAAFFAGEDDQEPPRFLSTTKKSGLAERNAALAFRPLEAALRDVPPEPEFDWDGYLVPGAITLVAGRPKVGKTTWLFALLETLLAGLPFLDRTTRKRGVLLLSEEREGTLKEKESRFNLEGRVHLLMRHEKGDAAWSQVIEHAVAHCEEHELGVLVVDTWDKWTGLKGDDENKTGAILGALEPLMLAASRGLAVLVVAHQRKSQGEHGDAVKGSNALTGGVDVVVEFERAGAGLPSNVRVLRAISRYASTPEDLVCELVDDVYRPLGSIEAATKGIQHQEVLNALQTIGLGQADEIADATNMSASTARRRCNELVYAGKLRREGAGGRGDPHRWGLTEFLSTSPDYLSGGKKAEWGEAP
jgi:hypothetical protein